MKIYFDENMPFAREFFADFGELTSFSGRSLVSEDVTDADVLLVRSITKVNQHLLEKNKKLSFVGTATIGVDHIDQLYLAQRHIAFHSAPGCNAISVAEYVLSSLVVLAERYLLELAHLTVGIVGAGNTGTQLSKKLDALGIAYKLCDPLLSENPNDNRHFVLLEEALTCDVISLHVPLTTSETVAEHATHHLLNNDRLSALRDDQILISACRGEVIDNHALLTLKQQGLATKLVLDVWEGEPTVLLPLIEYCEISTAHIAGYSLEGKARGTEMLYQALCKQLKQPITRSLSDFLPVAAINSLQLHLDAQTDGSKQDEQAKKSLKLDQRILNPLVKMVYDVRRDDAIFRQQIFPEIGTNSDSIALNFDGIRKSYPARREFSSVQVTCLYGKSTSTKNKTELDVPHQLGFSTLL